MKSFVSSILPLLFYTDILLSSLEVVEANNLRASNNDQAAAQKERRRLRELELANGTRIIAKFHGRRGERLIKKCANKIFQDNGEGMIIVQGNGNCMQTLQDDPDVQADFDFPVQALGTVTTTTTTRKRRLKEVTPWGLEMIHADKLQAGDHEITICLVDTGIAVGHPDFDQNQITGVDSKPFYVQEPWRWNLDRSGHGTHIAGTLAALAGNGIGIQGAGQFRLHVTRGINDQGEGYESDVRNAIQQCVEAGANVINLSLGSNFISGITENVINKVVNDEGILMIAAAGNNGGRVDAFPASHPSVISVGAVSEWGTRWSGSNYGDQLELSAPGSQILSTSVTTREVQVRQDDSSKKLSGFVIQGTGQGSVSGSLAYCSNGSSFCPNAQNNICVMVHEESSSIQQMLKNCQDSNGMGAIIFDTHGNGQSTWSVTGGVSSIFIPAMGVNRKVGIDLIRNRLGEQVTIGDTSTTMEYSYEELNGTSMATVHVTAAAALVWSHFGPTCSNHQIRYALDISAQAAPDSKDGDCTENYGYGIVDAIAAFEWLQKNDCVDWQIPHLSEGGCTTL